MAWRIGEPVTHRIGKRVAAIVGCHHRVVIGVIAGKDPIGGDVDSAFKLEAPGLNLADCGQLFEAANRRQ